MLHQPVDRPDELLLPLFEGAKPPISAGGVLHQPVDRPDELLLRVRERREFRSLCQSRPVRGSLLEPVPKLLPEFLDVPPVLADVLVDHVEPPVEQVQPLGEPAVERLGEPVGCGCVH